MDVISNFLLFKCPQILANLIAASILSVPELLKKTFPLFVIFESKEAYVANANRPEQHESFLKMMEHLASEPTWNDGTYVIAEIA